MSSNTKNTERSRIKIDILARIETYLDKIARGFDRKSYNAPSNIITYTVPVPKEWINVGFVPRPTTRFGRFMYHMAHGIAMGYPFHRVVAFSLINTKPK